ncbi:MAG TPA: cellulase family glycosylhydrolase [Longimicrobium sp.]
MIPSVLRMLALAALLALPGTARTQEVWPRERAAAWQRETGWLVGSNYAPSSAINQLEMWQADTFDPAAIDRELGWAESIGLNTMRVFLHDLAYKQDPRGFLERVDRYLAIADRHKIRTMLVLFDGVWDPFPRPGRQRAPKPHLHNSGWVQSPGLDILMDTARHDELEGYVTAVVRRFANDRRVVAWDLFNEPDNTNPSSYYVYEPDDKAELALALLRKTFRWARAANPAQPLTVGPWRGDWRDPAKLSPLVEYMLANSDIISFHSYDPPETLRPLVAALQCYGRPILCTEYMARPRGSTFQAVLPMFKEQGVAAYNWGMVQGKSQTIYPWDSWNRRYTAEPEVWFHDIFRTDGTPYDPREVELIRRLTGRG